MDEVKFLVWIRTSHADDELYRVATAVDMDEVLAIIASAGVPLDRITVTPTSISVSLQVAP